MGNKLNKNFVLCQLITLAGIGVVGYACHVTKSAKPLWGLLLVPRWSTTETTANNSDAETEHTVDEQEE